jgi:tRNA 2-thiouridine synthesizing protein A
MIKENKILDVIGLRCPEPLMLTRKTMRELKDGEVLLVKGDDFSTTNDLPKLCDNLGYTILESNITVKPYYFYIKK